MHKHKQTTLFVEPRHAFAGVWFGFLCVSVSLIKQLAIRLRLAKAPAKSLVMW